jgi:hypothetical protein
MKPDTAIMMPAGIDDLRFQEAVEDFQLEKLIPELLL